MTLKGKQKAIDLIDEIFNDNLDMSKIKDLSLLDLDTHEYNELRIYLHNKLMLYESQMTVVQMYIAKSLKGDM